MTRGADIPSIARREALALLAVAVRDERAPLSIRITAARELLQRSEATRPVSVSDIASMTAEQRQELFLALVEFYESDAPGLLKEIFAAAVEEALQRQSQPRRIGFVRGDRTVNGGPRWPAAAAPHNQRRSVPARLREDEAAAKAANADDANERALEAEAGEVQVEAELPQRTVPIGFLTPEEAKAKLDVFDKSLAWPYSWRP